MKPKNGETVYRLIHSQEMVQYMWRYTLHMQATQIPVSIAFEEPLDFRIIARAVNVEIARNDCLRLRIFRSGLKIKQFFLKAYQLEKIPCVTFTSKEDQETYLDRDASKKLDVFGGECFRIIFFQTHDGKSGIYLNVSHMMMDFVATFIFFRDLMAVYDALKNGTDLPKPLSKYEDIIRNEQNNPALEARLKKEGAVLDDWVVMDRRPKFCLMNGQGVVDRHSRLVHKKDLNMPFVYMPLNDATHLLKLYLSQEDSQKISDFLDANNVSAELVLQLGLRTCLSAYNRHANDSLFWVLCPRRKTVKEKRCGGTLASPMPWREILPETLTFREALTQLEDTQAFLFRYSDVPFTTIRTSELKRFHMTLLQSCNSMMFSYLPLNEKTFGGRRFEFSGYNFGHYVMPVYTIATRDPWTGRFVFSYIHRLWLTNDADVLQFHDGVVRTLRAGIEDPDKTLGQIMEEVSCCRN